MAKLTIILLTVLATVASDAGASAAIPRAPAPARRSGRFLLASRAGAVHYPPLPSYGCSSKKSGGAAVCLEPGSPGPACCGGQCVDTLGSADHCGGCNKACKHGRTCCGGRCVDLLSDEKNCGSCSNQCSNKCNYGFCDYAQ